MFLGVSSLSELVLYIAQGGIVPLIVNCETSYFKDSLLFAVFAPLELYKSAFNAFFFTDPCIYLGAFGKLLPLTLFCPSGSMGPCTAARGVSSINPYFSSLNYKSRWAQL